VGVSYTEVPLLSTGGGSGMFRPEPGQVIALNTFAMTTSNGPVRFGSTDLLSHDAHGLSGKIAPEVPVRIPKDSMASARGPCAPCQQRAWLYGAATDKGSVDWRKGERWGPHDPPRVHYSELIGALDWARRFGPPVRPGLPRPNRSPMNNHTAKSGVFIGTLDDGSFWFSGQA
jgi:hypothetical protein